MNKLALSIILAASTCILRADSITLTFEGLQDNERISNFYAGGTGSLGSGPGQNYGITFTSDSLAIITNTVASGTGNFDQAPSGQTVAFFLMGAGDTMNVSAGFTTGFSFYYSAPFFPGNVSVYSGLNGTGSLLTSLSLTTTPTGRGVPPCNSTDDYCPWIPIGVSFTGTAQSVVFTGSANFIGFDNITLGSATPTPTVPEPSSIALLTLGMLCAASRLRTASN